MAGNHAAAAAAASEGSFDIEEFVWANDATFEIPWERFGQVFDLMQKGNRAFRENRIEEAIAFALTIFILADVLQSPFQLALKDAEKREVSFALFT
ncbi:hypothetical protein ACLOJK_000826 [Asimina triloba]